MTTKQLMQLVCNKFSLLENVNCGDSKRRQARSVSTAIKTSIPKEDNNFITRNTENNHEAVTYARGNSVAITTCSMIMTVVMTLLLLTFLLH